MLVISFVNELSQTTGAKAPHHCSKFKVPSSQFALECRRDLLDLERFDDVTDFDVVEAVEADAALEAGFDLRRVLLEAAERGDAALPHLHAAAEEARLRVARARDAALAHQASRARARLGRVKNLLDECRADPRFFERRLEQELGRAH